MLEPNNSNNFDYLLLCYPDLASCGIKAEEYVWTDPSSSVVKSRIFVETILKYISDEIDLKNQALSFAELLIDGKLLAVIPQQIYDSMQEIRLKGNKAAHGECLSTDTSIDILQKAFNVGNWFVNRNTSVFTNRYFNVPVNKADELSFIKKELHENEQLLHKLGEQIIEKDLEIRSYKISPKHIHNGEYNVIHNIIKPVTANAAFVPVFENEGFEFGEEIVKDTRTGLFWARNGNIPSFLVGIDADGYICKNGACSKLGGYNFL